MQGEEASHLFILSGQSNMAGLDPDDVVYADSTKRSSARQHVIVVKDAVGGQPIRRWYKDWKPASGDAPKGNGDLYDRLMMKVIAGNERQRSSPQSRFSGCRANVTRMKNMERSTRPA